MVYFLHTDEDVDVLVAELLRGRGFDVVTTREVSQLGQGDEEQLVFAVHHQRAFLTHNRINKSEIISIHIVT